MTKHIGIVACSAEGAALCYRTICMEGPEKLGRYAHPEITMHSHPLSQYMVHIDAGDWEGVAKLMLSSTEKLADAGADFVICPDNTIHEAFDIVADKSPLPWLHIAGEVAAEAKRLNFDHLGVLGTEYLMEGSVYSSKLAEFGIGHTIPESEDRERVNNIIFEELVIGRCTDQSRAFFTEAIYRLKNRGCDAVVLGCTEIPLIIDEEHSCLPTLDSTRLLARAALNRAIA